MADRIKRASAAEQFLTGKQWNRTSIEEAMPLIDKDFTPISDARASSEFRQIAAKNLLLKFWTDSENND
jgi:xanthine dehydrogenase small subunit